MIRVATLNDIPAIQKIARQHPTELGFVRRASLERAAHKTELYVAEQDGQIVGFVNWHQRRDGWNTIYELGVHRDYHGKGIGRALLYAVPCPVRLKCTVDNAKANKFYAGAGMRLVRTEPGKKRALNIYEMSVLNIIVRGNGTTVPQICRESGSAYGSAEQDTIYDWPFMIDVDFENPNWDKYMPIIRKHRPVQALVVDYTHPSQKDEMLRQVADLRSAGVLRVVVCVKFHGAAADVPADCIIGVSLRTNGKLSKGDNKFAGWMPNFDELKGRKCHLLGGSPSLQIETIIRLQGIGATVISVDGNAQFGAASRGSVWRDGKWKRKPGEKVTAYDAQLISSINIQRALNGLSGIAQQPLFAA